MVAVTVLVLAFVAAPLLTLVLRSLRVGSAWGLGHYRDMWAPNRDRELVFSDPAAEAAATRFRATLDGVENDIQNDDVGRTPHYDYLRPSRIDNSTHK